MRGCEIDLPGEIDDWAQGAACGDWNDDDDDNNNDNGAPKSHCGSIPQELDEWDPDPTKREFFKDDNSYRCALTSCNEAISSCAPINAGLYSPRSHAQPVFSYSSWKGGKLEALDTSVGDPPHGLADCSLIRAIAYHIDQTQAGDEVLIAIAAWSDVAWVIAKAVFLAKSRGVTVRAISGGQIGDDAWATTGKWVKGVLQASLGSDFKHWYGGDEHKPFGWQISHNKFVLIHRKSVAPQQYLVLITGANWARFDISRNCDLLIVDSKPIWSGFSIYWNELFKASGSYSAYYGSEFSDSERGLTAMLWPVVLDAGVPDPDGKTSLKNPFYRIISKYKKQPGTKIRIIAASWDSFNDNDGNNPGADLVKLLGEHRAEGSDVRVIGNHHRDLGCHTFGVSCKVDPSKPNVKSAPCETRDKIWDELNKSAIPWAKCPPHAKVLLISGVQIGDNKFHQAVYTGSMNISYLKTMPDAFIGVHDDPLIFSQYENWWKWLCSNTAMNRGGPSPVCGEWQPPSPKPKKSLPKPTHG